MFLIFLNKKKNIKVMGYGSDKNWTGSATLRRSTYALVVQNKGLGCSVAQMGFHFLKTGYTNYIKMRQNC